MVKENLKPSERHYLVLRVPGLGPDGRTFSIYRDSRTGERVLRDDSERWNMWLDWQLVSRGLAVGVQ